MNEPIIVTVTRDFKHTDKFIRLDRLLPEGAILYYENIPIHIDKPSRTDNDIEVDYTTSTLLILPAGTKLEWRVESEQATRYNADKLRWSLVDFKSLEPLVEVLEYGTKKYAVDNWKKGLKLRDIMDSLLRHVVEINNNQYIDEESKCLHMGHIMANAMFWIYFYNKNKENDNNTTD